MRINWIRSRQWRNRPQRNIRDSFYAGRQWSDIEDLNAQADTWYVGTAAPLSRELLQQAAKCWNGATINSIPIPKMIQNQPITTTADSILREELKLRAAVLKLHGLVAHRDELPETELPWVQRLIEWKEVERRRRGLERRLAAHVVRFQSLADFGWNWPDQCDQAAVREFFDQTFFWNSINLERKLKVFR